MGMFGGYLSAKPSSGCLPAPSTRGPCDHGRAEYTKWGAGGGLEPPGAGPAGKGSRYDAHRYKQVPQGGLPLVSDPIIELEHR